MARIKISNDTISRLNGSQVVTFPRYTTQLMNLANQNAQGTRPSVVGQLSDLFPEYLEHSIDPSVEDWSTWYQALRPHAIEDAKNRVMAQIQNLQTALPFVTEELVRSWLKDLIIDKTYNGMYFQEVIIRTVANERNVTFRLSNSQEESQGIDGYIDGDPVSIKPDTYEYMTRLNESIDVHIITYSKTKDGIWINY